ncbi:hypothetical protein COV19_01670 [Candidatus Woesearchaeota archaeon CG10_big_fil_rev_8_21_14_0_10_44_13]|nr:MAG: hypothetical protein COV19_01670 [Candidatus Woesearchaeota archaeon CG10_big_fil_rev_8_21_14_0_10_44_13]
MVVLSLEHGVNNFLAENGSGAAAESFTESPEEFFDLEGNIKITDDPDGPGDKETKINKAGGVFPGKEKGREEKEDGDVIKDIADLVNKRFLAKDGSIQQKKSKSKRPGRQSGNIRYKEDPSSEPNPDYKRIDELFSYLGKLQTATNIYRDHFIEYEEKKKQEEAVYVQTKPQDLDFNEFESIIRTKKMNDLMSGGTSGGVTANTNPVTGGYFGFEVIGATTQEKWATLGVFTYYKVLAMLRYSLSLT